MNLFELFLIAVGLSMDAFAVSICKGLSIKSDGESKRNKFKTPLIVGLYFGFFQAIMPFLGYLAGSQFADKIKAFDHWIAFILLAFIGGKMIKESLDKEVEGDSSITIKAMIPLSIATSIDALAAGISFAFLKVNIVPAVAFIGVTTFILSAIGVKIGNVFGAKFKSKAELLGGIILILIGLKILIEHIFII